MKKIIILSLLALFAISCAPNPHVVDVNNNSDMHLNCTQITQEIAETERYKVAAREDDRFMFKYMFPPTAIMAIYKINKAESRAIDRIEHLKQLYTQRNCHRTSSQQPRRQDRQMYNQQMHNQQMHQNNRRPALNYQGY